jgi:beta-D-xylosidase 4
MSPPVVSGTTFDISVQLVALFTLGEKINNTQNASPGVPRIGLPQYEWWNEALHGVANSPGVTFANSGDDYSYATSFPQPILMGAAFDDDLIQAVATVVSTEARAFNNGNMSGLNYWTPNINPYKDPRWGRGQETPGEDPFHLSRYVHQLIMGLQGGLDPQPYKKIVATCKHYAGYDLEDWEGNARYGFDAIISSQDLREYYLPPFQECARDSNVQSVMCSYNAVNGVPTCADDYLLHTVLREYWGWTDEDQWVTSDCDAVQNIYNASSWNVGRGHNYTQTPEQAVADALNAGTDLDCGTFYPDFLGQAYEQGLYNISTLDRSLIRRYASLVRLGYFDPPTDQPYRQLTFANVSTNASQSLALKAAEEGIVLLKNDGTLPLSSDVKVVALIGPWAAATVQMQGNYYGVAPYLHSPLYAAQAAGLSVMYAMGADINSTNTTGFAAALAIAKQADAIIYAGGIDISIEAESMV